MIHLDTNFLIASLVPATAESKRVTDWLEAGESVSLSVIACAEFLCGPVTSQQILLVASATIHQFKIPPADEVSMRTRNIYREARTSTALAVRYDCR